MPSFDTRVPAVLMRLDQNPFHHGTLGAVRSLGRAGIEVHTVVEAARGPVGHSRYLRRTHPRPDGCRDLAEIQRLLLQVSDRLATPAVLIPMDDLSAITVGQLQSCLTGRYLLPEQPSGLPERVADKAELVGICRDLGIPHPRTVIPGCAAEAADAVRSLGLPVIAKWSRPWLLPEAAGLRSTVLVRSADEARELYGRSAEAGSRLLLQEFLPHGRGLDWFFHGYSGAGGECLVGAAGRKERSWPVGAGLTAVGTWLPNPAVERTARQMVSALGYRGILDLDFRRDTATGAYHLLDFNPRPGAQFRLFTDRSGTDVVRALHLDLTGRAVPVQAAAHGRTFVVENYALLSALSVLPSGRARGTGRLGHDGVHTAGADGRGGAVDRSMAVEAAWFALDDPRPAYAMAVAFGLHAVRRGRSGLGRVLGGIATDRRRGDFGRHDPALPRTTPVLRRGRSPAGSVRGVPVSQRP
ncbi:ATP-grasp domain-containing protein [Streptomyces sp. NPDC056672]|uniref:carboxylate--amine ligase n=1 Tax=Streptomyces sp. NPDC056672 TaxID=3345906 RepID=UPI0036C28274